jgi:hypothetical protein
MADEAAEFWNAFEKETGEKVEARSEGRWFRVPESSAAHEGLLILTDRSFRFKYVPEPYRPFMGSGTSPELEDRTEFTVARGDIVSVSVPKRRFFARLTSSISPRCSVVTRSEGKEKTYVISADDPSSGLVATLEKAWPAVAGTVAH